MKPIVVKSKMTSRSGLSWLALGVACAINIGVAVAAGLPPAPAGVVLTPHGHGWVLQDAKGMALYTTVKDQMPGKSACNDQCAAVWPPLKVDDADAAKAAGDWSIVTRDDGSKQWAFEGQPLYRFSRDLAAGDTYGNDVDGEWAVATRFIDRPTTFSVARNELGYVMTDSRSGTTLYWSDKDKPGKDSPCESACLRTWLPQRAPLMARDEGDWSVLKREDGIRQWAYKGRPLYRFTGDREPGDTNGNDAEQKQWHAAVLEPSPATPAWVTVQGSDAGALLADAKGRTLYGRNAARGRPLVQGAAAAAAAAAAATKAAGGAAPAVQGALGAPAAAAPKRKECGFECPGMPWVPVLASSTDKPVGNWSIVDRPDGKKQWAFKGEPLFTHTRDSMPGMLNGARGGDRNWHTLMRSGRPMQGTGA